MSDVHAAGREGGILGGIIRVGLENQLDKRQRVSAFSLTYRGHGIAEGARLRYESRCRSVRCNGLEISWSGLLIEWKKRSRSGCEQHT